MKLTEKGDEVGRDLTVRILKKLSKPARQQMLEYYNTGILKESKRESIGSSLSVNTLNFVKLNTDFQEEDYAVVVKILEPLFKNNPDFSAKKTMIVKKQKIFARAASMVNACRINSKVRDEIGSNINDGKWLLGEVLVQLKLGKDLNKFGIGD